jgi:hypothetical protein
MSDTNKIQNIQYKPYLAVFLIIVVLSVGYYFLWNSTTNRVTDVIKKMLISYKYASIEVSGFPFKKNIKIKNIVFSNDSPLINKTQAIIDEVNIDSFIFSKKMSISFKDIKVVNPDKKDVYALVYNEDPEVFMSIFSDDRLNYFKYNDTGYRVIDTQNETLYTAGNMFVEINSVRVDETINYNIKGYLENLKNFNLFALSDGEIKNGEDVTSLSLNLDAEWIASWVHNKPFSNSIKINSLTLSNNEVEMGNITADLINSGGGTYTFGYLTLKLNEYIKVIDNLQKVTIEQITNDDNEVVEKLKEEDKKAYISITNGVVKKIVEIFGKNPETNKDGIGVLTIQKNKGDPSFYLNDINLISIVNEMLLLR